MKIKSVVFLIACVVSLIPLLNAPKVQAENLANCLHANVSISATNWPGGTITAQCDGDSGPSGCVGESGSAAPGGSINLQKCSCPPYADGCIHISNSQIPSQCTAQPISAPVCGVNGNNLAISLVINCPAPPSPCTGGAGYCGDANGNYATSCPYGAEPTSWNQQGDNWCSSSTYNSNNSQAGHCFTKCKPAPPAAPKCGDSCAGNPNLCQNIAGCNYCNPASNTCTAPPATNPPVTNPPVTNPPVTNPPVTNPPVTNPPNPTATPTTAPVCGADCSQSPNICQNISGCNYCNPTSKKCEAQPTPTATATPSPTPPPYDESMCSCDSLNFTPIALGVTTKVTAYGKVLGVNKNYAKIPTFTFTWYQSPPNSAQATIKKQDKVNTTVIEDTAEKVRYQAIWDLDVPTNLDTTQTYRIQAHPDCSRKAAAAYFNENTAVMGTATAKQPSLWDRIAGFFAGIFGGGKPVAPQAVGPTATPTLTPREKALQLKTFKPVNVTTGIDAKNCTFIKFSF